MMEYGILIGSVSGMQVRVWCLGIGSGGFVVDSLQLRAVSAGQGHGDEQHLFRAKGTVNGHGHGGHGGHDGHDCHEPLYSSI